jgi:spore coat protein CotF
MKRILVVFSFAFLLLAGCDTKEFYTVIIANESSITVSYVYNDSTDTLVVDESKTYEVKAYTQPPKVDESIKQDIKVKYNTMTGDYTFIDAN